MTIRQLLNQFASNFGSPVSIINEVDGISTTYIDETIYRSPQQGGWTYVFYTSSGPIDFDAEHVTQIVTTRNGTYIY